MFFDFKGKKKNFG